MILVGVGVAEEEDGGLGLLRETVGAPEGATVRSRANEPRREATISRGIRVWSVDPCMAVCGLLG